MSALSAFSRFVARLKTEPTLLVQLTAVAVGLLISFDVISFTQGETGAVLTVASAVTGVFIALTVRPFQWAAIAGLVQALIVGAAEFGFSLTESQVANVYAATAVLGLLIVRQTSTPETKLPPVPTVTPAPVPSSGV